MDLVEQVHIFGLANIHTFGPNFSLIRLFSLMLNYAKPRLLQDKIRSSQNMYVDYTLTPVSFQIYVVPPQSWGDRSDTKHSKCLLLGGRRLNQLTLIPKPKGSGGTRAATAQVGPANKRNDTKRCLPVEASLRPGEAVPW